MGVFGAPKIPKTPKTPLAPKKTKTPKAAAIKKTALRRGLRCAVCAIKNVPYGLISNFKLLGFLYAATLFDAGFLTGKTTQVVEFRTTHLTILVYGDGVDERALDGEDTLYTDAV